MSAVTLPSGHARLNHVELVGVTKRFPGVVANADVSFDVRAGEIHALLGENGAGKSTLMKQLYGLYRPDSGDIRLDGRVVRFTSPSDALAQGIGMIHQHFMLVPTLTVAENVALGVRGFHARLGLGAVRRRLADLARRYGLRVNPDARVWQLSVDEQQRVEIVKALYHGGALLILDEPTAVLTPQEVDELFVTLRQMRDQGHALVFITHKLNEVQALADRVTVMRDGRTVATVPNDDQLTHRALARLMVGREVQLAPSRADVTPGPARLRVKSLGARNDRGLPALHDVTFDVHAGEIVGVAGVSGNGQRELAEVIAGLRAATGGGVWLGERNLLRLPVAARAALGVAFVPEERNKHGVIGDFTVADNAVLHDHARPPYARAGLVNGAAVRRHTQALIDAFRVKTPSPATPVKALSGGNVQKLIIGRELSRQPDVLVVAQPTRGVDIGATEQIRAVLMAERARGAAVLLISEDLDEIMALADRVLVLYEGRVMADLPRSQADVERLGLLMAGVNPT